jgi:hypothetical protein
MRPAQRKKKLDKPWNIWKIINRKTPQPESGGEPKPLAEPAEPAATPTKIA